MSISRTAQFRPVEHAAGRVMDGELVIINFHSGLYYSSVGVGTAIWQLMQAGHSLAAIATTIASDMHVATDTVEADVTGFLDQLLAADLIETADGPASEVAAEYSGSYAAPTLTAFNDLEKSFALDPPLQQ
jgi:hypothetical protein